jgi:competence protein ComEA
MTAPTSPSASTRPLQGPRQEFGLAPAPAGLVPAVLPQPALLLLLASLALLALLAMLAPRAAGGLPVLPPLGAGPALLLAPAATGAAPAGPAAAPPLAAPGTGADAPPHRPAPAVPVNLNSAGEKELLSLPGVSKAMARKIIAGRPYGAVDDLVRAGIPLRAIERIRRLVVVTAPPAAAAAPRSEAPIRGAAGPRVVQSVTLTAPPPPRRVDINHASLEELQTLPGVDAATAARIIAARPYADVEALERTGIPAAVIARLAPLAWTGPEPP